MGVRVGNGSREVACCHGGVVHEADEGKDGVGFEVAYDR
jgi:hypothetical protein